MAAGLIIIMIIVIFVLLNRNYKKEIFEPLAAKGNELKIIYPAALYLLVTVKKFGISISNIARKKKIESLNVTLDKADSELMYNVRRISISLVVLLCGALMNVLYFLAQAGGTLSAYKIIRPDYGQSSEKLSILANGEEMEIEVGAVEFSLEETTENFVKAYEYLLENMTGDNDSLENVSSNLILPTYIDAYAISVSWLSSMPQIIDIYGTVSNEDFRDGYSEDVVLTAVLSYLDYTCEYEINVTVVEKELNEIQSFIRDLRIFIKEREAAGRADKELLLPDNFEDTAVVYEDTDKDSSYILLLLGIVAAAAVFWGMDKDLDKKISDRNKEMLLDYSEIVSKLNILTGAGMSTFRAWEKIVLDYEQKAGGQNKRRFAYEEMKLAYNSILSGISEGNAYSEFGKRCNIHEYLKLGALLEQNVKKGAKGLSKMLEEEAVYAFEQRKNLAKKLGEEAGTKMLMPMMLMLLIVMVIVMIPAFTSF
jgi:hypothetical protein